MSAGGWVALALLAPLALVAAAAVPGYTLSLHDALPI